jgi:glycine cleavage system H protein
MSVPTPADLRYTASHEWVRDDSGLVTVGITDHAQDALGELVYVELPAIGRAVKQGEAIVVVESTKAASDVYAPVDGEVVEINAALSDTPQSINEAPYGAGWLLKIKPSNAAQLQALMDATTYSQSAKD